jgi:radical SAM-linked protein
MTNPDRYRYRVTFGKSEAIRFISHLDLHHTWERTLRRARLPVYHSQGFKPRPKINLSPALPLGQTSECELMDVWLEAEFKPERLLEQLKSAAPQGLQLFNVKRVALSEKSLQSRVTAAIYTTSLAECPDLEDLQASIDRLLQADELLRERRNKKYDLRPLIETLSITAEAEDRVGLKMKLSAREGASGRPDEVLLEMGYDPEQAHIHRQQLFFDSESSE